MARVVIGSLAILLFSPLLEKIGAFPWIGQNVLIMYLGHLPVMRMVEKAARATGLDPSETITGSIVIIVSLRLTGMLARGIVASAWLSAFVTPRNFSH